MNKKNITITGDLGSGKSYLSNYLTKKLKCKYVSTGKIQRQIAEKYNMSTLELNKYSESNKKIDEEIDGMLIKLNDSSETHVVDSRLAWFFIPDSFKIYLRVEVEVAANRIYNDNRGAEKYTSLEHTVKDILSRKESENSRFLKYYNADCANMNNFDAVIDTSYISVEELCELILELRQLYLNNSEVNRYWLSPKSLIPTQDIRAIGRRNSIQLRATIKEKGYNINYPIDVALYRDRFFIVDGHQRTSSAIFSNLSVIPVNVIVDSEKPFSNGISVSKFVEDSYNQSSIYDWEDCHNIRLGDIPVN